MKGSVSVGFAVNTIANGGYARDGLGAGGMGKKLVGSDFTSKAARRAGNRAAGAQVGSADVAGEAPRVPGHRAAGFQVGSANVAAEGSITPGNRAGEARELPLTEPVALMLPLSLRLPVML